MPHTLFISDLHLSTDDPLSMAEFRQFIHEIAPKADALYILGDLFEYWAGDDDLADPFHAEVASLLASLSQHGTALYLLHGNRDLLMGRQLAEACHATLLDDPALIDLYGTPTLLSHGDALCTDDIAYQRYRTMVQDKAYQRAFLDKPLAERKTFIAGLRARSREDKQQKDESIMDVNVEAVESLLREYRYPRLIHGHTHRPARHEHVVDGHACERWVLADWSEQGSALRIDATSANMILFRPGETADAAVPFKLFQFQL